MNRLTASALLYEAELGKTVLVLSENTQIAYGSFHEVHRLGQHLGLVQGSRFSVGNNRLDLWNGKILFRSLRQERQLHGFQPDLVYVEEIRDRRLLEQVYRGALRPMQARGAELVVA